MERNNMSSCNACYSTATSIRCLLCQKYFCLTCSGIHRYRHLLDAFEKRLTSHVDSLKIRFDENFYRKYNDSLEKLQHWINEIRQQFEATIQDQLERFLKTQFDLLKLRTDEYLQEYVDYFIELRSNVQYAKQRHIQTYNENELLRLISIEKELLKLYDEHYLKFQLDTKPIDFTKYLTITKQFHESPILLSFGKINYQLNQPIQTIHFQSIVQHVTSSCLDLFVFTYDKSPKYPSLIEYSTSSLSTKISVQNSIDFPANTQIIDICWSVQFNCLFLLTTLYLHKYDKFEKRIHANILRLTDQMNKWHRMTTNRFGIYILNETNSIEYYNRKYAFNGIFYMKDLIDNVRLVYDLQGQSNSLCTLTYTKEYTWQIDLFSNRELKLKRTLKLSDTLRPPLKLINANRKNTWIIIDSENHRLILFEDQMKNIEHFSLAMTPSNVTVLDDKTLVVASPDLPGSKISFYSPTTYLPFNENQTRNTSAEHESIFRQE